MRVPIPPMILILAYSLVWNGWFTAPTQAAAPGIYRESNEPTCCTPDTGQGCCACEAPADQEPCEEPLGFLRELCSDRSACWTFVAEAIALQRTSARNQPLVLSRLGTIDLLNANTMNFPVETGLQLGAIRHGPNGWDLEAAYFQIDGWAVDRNVIGVSQLVTDVTGGNFFVNNAAARCTSQLHLGEFNLRHEWFDGLTLLVGFRFGELDELYSAGGAGVVPGTTVNMRANTFNHLYGFQVGADWQFYNMGGPLTINALCKAGIYGNSANQRIHQADSSDPASNMTLEAHRSQAAFLGETGLVATYQITRHLSFRASAEAVWLEGVALAPEQIGASDFMTVTATIDTHGSIFYYGGGMGLELKF
jgi:hypothetical protein